LDCHECLRIAAVGFAILVAVEQDENMKSEQPPGELRNQDRALPGSCGMEVAPVVCGCRHIGLRQTIGASLFQRMRLFGGLLAWLLIASTGSRGVMAGELATGSLDIQAEWPTFHGPRRDNLVRETGLLKRWPDDGPRLLWKSSVCGKGYAAVSVARGCLFISGDFGEEEMVLALNLNGSLKWKTVHGKAWTGAQPGSRTTPTYDDGLVYHLGPHGNLSAFEAASGKPVWTIDIREQFTAPLGLWGYTENLVVDGDQVLCTPGGAAGRVVALDKKTGRVRWANTEITDRQAYSSPIVAEHGGVRQFIALARNSFFGVDIRTGSLLWSHPHESFCDQNVTSPIYHDGSVFVSSGHRAGARVVKLSADNRDARPVWSTTQLDNCHGGVVLLDGYLYGSGCRLYNKGLLCVEFATGKVMYRAEQIGKVSLTWADGLLYCLDNDGEMLLVQATPQRATVLSRFKIPRNDNDHTLTHPVVCGGRLYLRHLDDLFAYNIRAD
jgi:outer membrane protein assembly factor BamB